MLESARSYIDTESSINILDIGSEGSGGAYDNIFKPNIHWHYTGCDIVAGPNVDVVMNEPYVLPFENRYFDLVISGQAAEHMEYPWLMFEEIARVLKSGGMAFIIAPGAGPIHHNIDCWRFNPDGMKALAKWAKLEVIKAEQYYDSEWHDTLLVCRKK